MSAPPEPDLAASDGASLPTRTSDAARGTRPHRLAFVDQVRALAALYVALYHALLVLWPNVAAGEHRALPPSYLRIFDFGHVGVAVFIVVSGYSLALGPARRGVRAAGPYWRFMLKRARRLLPPYWVALAVSIVLLALAPQSVHSGATGIAGEFTKQAVPFKSVAVFALLLQDFFSRFPSPNSPLWSIAVEWHLYFVFPLLLVLARRYGFRVVLIGSVTVGVGLHVLLFHTGAIGTTPHFLALFTMGIVSAYATADRPARAVLAARPRLFGWLCIGGAWVTFGLLWRWEMGADLLVGALVATGLWILGSHPSGEPRSRPGHALAAIGLISYSFYLVHAPVEKVAWKLGVSRLDLAPVPAFVALVAVSIPVALTAAWILFKVVEQPSMRWSARVNSAPHGQVALPDPPPDTPGADR